MYFPSASYHFFLLLNFSFKIFFSIIHMHSIILLLVTILSIFFFISFCFFSFEIKKLLYSKLITTTRFQLLTYYIFGWDIFLYNNNYVVRVKFQARSRPKRNSETFKLEILELGFTVLAAIDYLDIFFDDTLSCVNEQV